MLDQLSLLAQYDNSPSPAQVIPEIIWASAAGGGTWVTEIQITDRTGGHQVSVYFNYGRGNCRGPFLIWTSPGANSIFKINNFLSFLDDLDLEAFKYFGRVGGVGFYTQDLDHNIHVTARIKNGYYSKTI